MPRLVAKATVGALGVDCVQGITTAAIAKGLYDAGMRFAVRYLGSVTNPEVELILNAGLALMPVTYSRNPGWTPSGALGKADGAHALQSLQAAGIPKGCTVWLDLEGPGGHAQDVIDWVNGWAAVVIQAGYEAGLYVGYGTMLTSTELYKLQVTRYWHSVSKVTDSAGQLAEPGCGWCMYQLHPSVSRAGVWVDVDVVQEDYQGRVPNWVVRG